MKKKLTNYSSVNHHWKKLLGCKCGWLIETTDVLLIIKDYNHSRLIDYRQEIKSKLGEMIA